MGLVAPQHEESFQARDQTHFLCISRWILNHWTIREVLRLYTFDFIYHISLTKNNNLLNSKVFYTIITLTVIKFLKMLLVRQFEILLIIIFMYVFNDYFMIISCI